MGNAHREVKEPSSETRGLDGLAKKDDLTRGGGEPLFIRVEDALRHQADRSNEWKAAGPPSGSISVWPTQRGRCPVLGENGVFPLRPAEQDAKSKKQNNCNCHVKTHCGGLAAVKGRGTGSLPLVHPLTNFGIWVCEDGHGRSIPCANKKCVTESNKAARQVDLALTHSFHNSDLAPGDFTSITFSLEDFDDAEIHRSTLSLPSTRTIDLDAQILRPLTSPASSGNSLFVTSQPLGSRLGPRDEQILLDSDSLVDLSHNLESWMSHLPEALQHLPLNYLYIPGEIGSLVSPTWRDSSFFFL